jgi:hypothetical protein
LSLYNSDGQIVITQVDGVSYTGLYAADGTYNAVVNDNPPPGLYHPCGAFNAVSVADTSAGFYSPSGAVNVILNETTDQLVLVVPNG